MRPSTALAGFFLSTYSVSCLKTEMGYCPRWLLLAPAEQSIKLFICHTSRLRLCYRLTTRQFLQWKFIYINFSGNQSKSQEKVWANWNCLSLFTSHVVSTSRAEHTTSSMGRATTSFISYHQLGHCYLKTINLNLGRSCGNSVLALSKLSLFVSVAFSWTRQHQS